MKTKIALFVAICLFACQKAYQLEPGYWTLEREGGTKYLVEIKGDTMKTLFPAYQEDFISLMNLTKDSINLPNPCVLDRVSYFCTNEGIVINDNYLLAPINEISSELIFENTDLEINLNKITDTIKTETPYIIDFTLFIGKSDFEFKALFEDEYQLKINDFFADSVRLDKLVNALNNRSNPSIIVIYVDKEFNNQLKEDFIFQLQERSSNNIIFYEAYFSCNAPYFVEYKKHMQSNTN